MRSSLRDHLWESLQLSPPQRRQDIAQAVVVPDVLVLVPGERLPRLSGQVADAIGEADSSSVTSIPPPLVVMILLPLKEKIPIWPKEPAIRSPCEAPSASAASSMRGTSILSADAHDCLVVSGLPEEINADYRLWRAPLFLPIC